MHTPSIKHTRHVLAAHQRAMRKEFRPADLIGPGEDTPGTDVRLQVYSDGGWSFRWGPSDYDQDHHGYWGATFLPYGRTNLSDLARDLIEQIRDDMATEEQQV